MTDARTRTAFAQLGSLMHHDEAVIVPQATKLFLDLKRKTRAGSGTPMPAGVNDTAVACIAILLVNESQGDKRDVSVYQKRSSLDAKSFKDALALARRLLDSADKSRSTRSSSHHSTPPSSGKRRRRDGTDGSGPDGTPSPSPSSGRASASSKRPRQSLQTTPRDRSAEMKAYHARSASMKSSPSTRSQQPTSQPHTPTKSSPLKPKAKPVKTTPLKTPKATPTSATSIAKAAKRAEKRAEEAEKAQRPPERAFMVPDYELNPWSNFTETFDERVRQAKAKLREIWGLADDEMSDA